MEEKDRSASPDAFSAALDGILSNPEMMSMISSMAQKLKDGSGTSAPEADAPEEAGQAEEPISAETVPTGAMPSMGDIGGAMSALAPLLSGGLFGGSAPDDKRTCLLRALKPYLSKNRCEAIDHIITLSRLSGMFKKRT